MAVIVSGLVPAGLVTVRRSLTVVAWSNVGTAVLPFVVAIDVRLGALWLIGLAGIGARTRRLMARRGILEVLLGVGILLFGLTLLRAATAPLTHEPAFVDMLGTVGGSMLVALLVGAGLVLVFQSSGAVVVIVILLTMQGRIDDDHALAVICGTGYGAAALVLIMGRGLRGEAARVTWWQAILNISSATLVAAWALLGDAGVVPSLGSLLASTGMRFETELAVGFLVQRSLCAVVAIVLGPWAPGLLERIAPEPPESELGRLRYLNDTALRAPEMALELVRLEQQRMLDALPALLDGARSDDKDRRGLDPAAVRTNLGALDREIRAFLRLLVERSAVVADGAGIGAASARQEALGDLVITVADLATEVRRLTPGGRGRALGATLADASDLLLHALADAARTRAADDRELVLGLTADRSARMDRLRELADRDDGAEPADHSALLYATSLFERAAWLAHRFADRLPIEEDPALPDRP